MSAQLIVPQHKPNSRRSSFRASKAGAADLKAGPMAIGKNLMVKRELDELERKKKEQEAFEENFWDAVK